MDEDGAATVIHADEDESDPAGESYGARITCRVLATPAGSDTPALGSTNEVALTDKGMETPNG